MVVLKKFNWQSKDSGPASYLESVNIFLFEIGEDLQSAAATKLQVLKTCIDLAEALISHFRSLIGLAKGARDTLTDHYKGLVEDLREGQGI